MNAYRIKTTLAVLFLLFSNLLFAQIPDENLSLWLVADSTSESGGKVSIWNDQSSNGFTFISPAEANNPNKISGEYTSHAFLSFDGTTDYFYENSILNLGTNSNLLFIVYKRKENSTGYILAKSILANVPSRFGFRTNRFNYHDNSLRNIDFTCPNEELIVVCIENNRTTNTNTVYINGSTVGNSSINGGYDLSNPHNFLIGGYNDNTGSHPPYPGTHFKGDLGEIILYSEANDGLKDSINNYLMDKYSPKLDLDDELIIPYGFCDTLIHIDQSFTDILWSTGSTNDTLTINQTAEYTVEATDIFNRIQRDTINILYPDPDFINTNICLGDSVKYSVDLLGPYTYLWSQGSTDSMIWIKDEGSYSVQLTDTNGCSQSFDFFVNVDSFANHVSLGSDLELCSGNNIALVSGEDECESFLWSPGGNTTPTQTVNTSGWQTITVLNSNGCTAIDSIYVSITGTAPTPAYSVDNLCFGDITSFTDESTSPENITSWTWIINETDSINTEIAEWTFSTSGIQNISLLVASESGCSNSVDFDIEIKDNPLVSYIYSPICQNVEMSFYSDIQLPPESSTTSYEWSLESEIIGNEQSLNYTFSETGEFLLNLNVEADNGCTAEYSEIIEVVDSYPLSESDILIYPNNNFVYLSNNNLEFTWNNSSHTSNFIFQLSSDELFTSILFENESPTPSVSTNINYDQDTLYWRVISYNPCLVPSYSDTRKIFRVSPNSHESNILWLKADSVETIGTSVERWFDNSTNDYFINQSNESFRPSLQEFPEINNQSALVFNGTNSYLSGGDILDLTSNSHTFIFIYKQEDNADGYIFAKNIYGNLPSRYGFRPSRFNYQDISARNLDTRPVNDTFCLVTLINDRNELINSSYINQEFDNETNIADNHNFNTDYDFLIGAFNNDSGTTPPQAGLYHKGQIAEIIIYDTVLNETETEQVHQYLRHKYSPPVNLGYDIHVPYGFCDTTITTAEKPWFTEYLWSTGDTTPTISTNHNGEYTVTVTDIFGFTSTDDIRVNFPKVEQLEAVSMVCDGDSLAWDSGMASENYTFNWLNSASNSPIGEYWTNTQAALQVTDTNGCSFFTDTIDVVLDMYEHTAGLGDGDTALCNGNLLTLVSGLEETVEFLWQDGSTDDELLIESAGQYHVTVTNALGCIARDTIDVSILGTVPEPFFQIIGHCAENDISLLDESTSADGIINAWEWSHNGSVFATGEQAYINFQEAGEYDVTLEVFTDVGCHHHLTLTADVHPLPIPDFVPTTVCADQNTEFQSLSTISSDELYRYYWYFTADGNMQSTEEESIYYLYDTPGVYEVTLWAESTFECLDSITKTVEVRATPLADFTTGAACEGEAVAFWNQSSANGSTIWENQWNFGDGETSENSDPEHLYAGLDEFEVQLIVKNLNGCSDTIVKNVQISPLPNALTGNLNACQDVEFTLDDESTISSGSIVDWEWQVGSLIFDEENPVLTLSDTTDLPLRLKVWSDAGCVSIVDSMMYVWENPVAEFELPQNWGAVPLSMEIENNSDGASEYIWNFGDGESSTDDNPLHTWLEEGNYIIHMKAISDKGCVDSTQAELRVIIPLVDVAIIGLRAQMDGNYLIVEADVINPGTVPIENLALELNAGNGEIVREIMENEFAEGAVMIYTFTTQLYIQDGQVPEYICVQANPGATDETPENNKYCIMNSPEFALYDMYPNPVNDILNVRLLLPSNGELNVQVFDNTGKLVYSNMSEMDGGYHQLQLDCTEFSSGRYQLRLSFEDEEIVKSFVK